MCVGREAFRKKGSGGPWGRCGGGEEAGEESMGGVGTGWGPPGVGAVLQGKP